MREREEERHRERERKRERGRERERAVHFIFQGIHVSTKADGYIRRMGHGREREQGGEKF